MSIMRTFANKFILASTFLAGSAMISNAQVVYWNGLGRALVSGNWLNGNALKNDASSGQMKDTTSARKATDGYTLFDLGVNAQPNEALRAHASLRLINSFGGFYGDGSQFLFRQIRLDGIISKKVKYEVGDIDLQLTPYTLFNFSEIYNDYESTVLGLRRSVVEYENFNFGNKWRLQGAHLQSSLRFNRGVERLGIRFFATRNRRYVAPTTPDRFLIGGRLELLQSRNFRIGGNYTYLFDAPLTVNSAQVINKNSVYTVDFKANHFTDKIDYSVFGEAGMSKNMYNISEVDSINKSDYFYDLGVSAKYKPMLLTFYVKYRNVGADFFSSGAQTRRIYDFMNPGSLDLFNNLANNPGGERNTALLDLVSDQTIRNLNLQSTLMSYNPIYNNITPYGQATPNRKGLTIGASLGNMEKLVKADVVADLLSEVVSEGDSVGKNLRSYTGIRGGLALNAHQLLKFEKHVILTLGARYEKTTRSGLNKIDLSSTLIDAGLDIELFKKFDALFGYKYITAKGNEFIYARDAYNQIAGNPTQFEANLNQGLLSYGLRYRFSKNTYFTMNGVHQAFVNKDAQNLNYTINQVFFNYTMIF